MSLATLHAHLSTPIPPLGHPSLPPSTLTSPHPSPHSVHITYRHTQGETIGGWSELMQARRALVAGLGLVLLQQVTGQPSVLYYQVRRTM